MKTYIMHVIKFVLKIIHYFKKITLFSFVSVFLISCCPKDGVDRSSHSDSYNITIDIFDLSIQQPVNLLDTESKLTLVLNDSTRKESESFKQNEAFHNRYTFYFNSSIQDEHVSSIEVKLIDYKNQIVNYKTAKKIPFQQDPISLTLNRWDSILCAMNPIDWILPKAQAFSCKAKEGSKITFRSGYLLSVGLYPEDP